MLAPSPAGPDLHLFPVRIDHKTKITPGKSPYDKKPTVQGWENCHRDDWPLDRWSIANAAGLACGKDVYLLDLDTYKPDSEAGRWMTSMGLDKLPTRVHRSMTGGYHYWYRLPPGFEDLPTRTGVVPGLDTRGVGGYGVWTGEFDGKSYKVARDLPMAELPVEVCEELRRGAAAHKARKTADTGKPPPVLDLDEMFRLDDIMDANPKLAMALGAEWGDRSNGLIRCAGETLRADINDMEEFEKLVWHSNGNARKHAIEKGWSRSIIRAWDEAKGSGKEDFEPLPEEEEDPLGKSGVPHRPVGLRTLADLASNFVPPSFLVRGLIRRASLYTATGITGSGKTAVMVELSLCVATGTDFAGYKITTPGPVAYFAGENPDDTIARFIAAAERRKIGLGSLPISIRPDALDIPGRLDDTLTDLEQLGTGLVIVDTLQAHLGSGVEDDSHNKQMLNWALAVRAASKLTTRPAIVVVAHPLKGATKDQLVPRGASALLNEVDGNFTVWREGVSNLTEFHFNKLRGAPFDPINFELETVTTPTLTSAEGDLMPTVLVKPTGAAAAKYSRQDAQRVLERVLVDMADHPLQPGPDRAARLGVDVRAVQRAIRTLVEERSVTWAAGRNAILTHKGKMAATAIRQKVKPDFDPLPENDGSERGEDPFE